MKKALSISITDIWKKYEQGKDFHRRTGFTEKTEKAHRFYDGDQWYGINSGGEELPLFNFIKPIVRYKVATITQKDLTAVFSPIDTNGKLEREACLSLNRYFSRMWELSKMDMISRKIIRDAAIGGDSYVFFGDGGDLRYGQIIDNTNIFFGDEKLSDIQCQPYIIIRERRLISDIIKEAEENGIASDEIKNIKPDDEIDGILGEKEDKEYLPNEGKCISLLYLYKDKDDGFLHSIKSTKSVIYQPDKGIFESYVDKYGDKKALGLKCYPIASYIWEDRKNSSRGVSEVEYLIPNQLEVNKTLARRSLTVKQVAYPKIVYNSTSIANPEDLEKVGSAIEVIDANAQGVSNIVSYLNAISLAPDAKNLSDELINTTRELAGAGEAALGSINPENASGSAIIAVRDQASLPLNEQSARFKQFVEDIALIWLDIWRAYNTDGIKEYTEDGVIKIEREVLDGLKVNVRIDACSKDSFSKYAEEQALSNLFSAGAISFEEYVEALSDDAIAPKSKLSKIVELRATRNR